jgi:hypothetical protein
LNEATINKIRILQNQSKNKLKSHSSITTLKASNLKVEHGTVFVLMLSKNEFYRKAIAPLCASSNIEIKTSSTGATELLFETDHYSVLSTQTKLMKGLGSPITESGIRPLLEQIFKKITLAGNQISPTCDYAKLRQEKRWRKWINLINNSKLIRLKNRERH